MSFFPWILVLFAAVASSAATISFSESEQYYLDVVACEIEKDNRQESTGRCWYEVAANIAEERRELTGHLVRLTNLQAEFMRRGIPVIRSIRAKTGLIKLLAAALETSSEVTIAMEIAELREHSE